MLQNPLRRPVSLQVHVYLAGSRGAVDLDNHIKSIQDGLNGIAWRDDCQIVQLKADITMRPGLRSGLRCKLGSNRLITKVY